MLRRLDVRLLALGAAGLLAGVAVEWAASFGRYRPALIPGPPVDLLVGWSFIGSGLASWRARPGNRLGPVMTGTGFAWFASLLQESHGSVLFTIGEVFQVGYLAGFLYVVLSFPSGLLWSALDRALVTVTIGLVTVVQVSMLLFAESRSFICDVCSANLLEVTDNNVVALGLVQFQRTTGLAVMVTTLGLLVVRLRRASRPQRQAIIPVLLAGGVALVALIASITADVASAPIALPLTRVAGYALAAVPLAVLIAFAQRRLARGVVAGLVVELGAQGFEARGFEARGFEARGFEARGFEAQGFEAQGTGAQRSALDLREALSRALGDPSLTLGYWFAAESRFVDSAGQPVELPSPDQAALRQSTVVERDGQPIAVLIHDPALAHNADLVDSVCAAAGLTLENERLHAELRARLAELQASRARLIEATEAERRRIERDLHDGTQQRLVSIALSLGLLESKLPAAPEQARPLVAATREALAAALAELRELTQGIHPTILAERGLPAALDELCRRASLPARLVTEMDGRLPDQVESAAYFFVSEGLANAAKHSFATEVLVTAACAGGVLTVAVDDDGIGGASAAGGTGLRGLTDRLEALGGRLSLASPPGQGTRLRAELPCG